MRRSGRDRHWTRVDSALVTLIRLVNVDDWSAETAAQDLRRKIPEDEVLRRLRGRVAGTLAQRSSGLGERFEATLDVALANRGARSHRPRS